MNVRRLISAFLCCLALLLLTQRMLAQITETQSSGSPTSNAVASRNPGPVVNDWEPRTGSAGSVIELRGYRLHPHDLERTKIFFIQNGVEFPVRNKGASSVTNDEFNGTQTLDVIVPDKALMGVGHFVVEENGQRSAPATVTITEWKAPIVKSLTPNSGPPGTIVSVDCAGFHADDEIEMTDGDGNEVNLGGGGSSHCTAFGIPDDIPEGVFTIRLGNKKHGNGQYSEPFTFTVTNDPLPIELITAWMKPVAPGQWLDLQSSSSAPLKHSERTEVSFKQAGLTIIVALPKPFRPHVEVPSALSPGEVQLQVRTWRGGRASEWSQPAVMSLAEKPAGPFVGAIRLEPGSWVHLWPGPDRATSFSVTPGAKLVMNGLWPVADASRLKVTLVRLGEVITLRLMELDEKSDCFGDMCFSLPESLAHGDWRMIVGTNGTQVELPLVIKVRGK